MRKWNLVLLALLIAVTVNWAISANGAECSVEAFFVSPTVNRVIEDQIIEAINGAEDSIYIALYSFTNDQLGAAVIDAYKNRGVDVEILLETGQENAQGGECRKLANAGIPVYVEQGSGLFHHKFAIIDLELVITGSYNWSDNADDRNFENVVFIQYAEIAYDYYREFSGLRLNYAFEQVECIPPGPLTPEACVIDRVDPVGECITLRNTGSIAGDLGGWCISDGEGNYTFPSGTIVQAGATYKVCIDTYNPTYYTRGLYLNNKDDCVLLFPPGESEPIDYTCW